MTTKTTAQMRHERDLELAKASAPKTGISVGGANKESVVTATAAIISIMKVTEAEDKTRREGLRALVELSKAPSSTSLNNCLVNIGE